MLLFESSDILDGSIRRISSHLRGPELPAEASMGEEIKAGLVVLDLGQYAPHVEPVNSLLGPLTKFTTLSSISEQ